MGAELPGSVAGLVTLALAVFGGLYAGIRELRKPAEGAKVAGQVGAAQIVGGAFADTAALNALTNAVQSLAVAIRERADDEDRRARDGQAELLRQTIEELRRARPEGRGPRGG